MLFRQAAKEYGWRLNYGSIAKMWRGGCIIRSKTLLSKITAAFQSDPALPSLLLDPFFRGALEQAQSSWRRVIAEAVMLGIPVPAMSSALAFFDAYRCARLPANMIQAQRDYFGAHTFEFEESPGTFHHVNWTGRGGDVSSTVYNA